MELRVEKYTGETEDNPYKKAFGDGFGETGFPIASKSDCTDIETAAQPSKIEFVHETLSGKDYYRGIPTNPKDCSKDGYRLVWNRYAKQLSLLCDEEHLMGVFADEVATAAEAISGTGVKWVDLTVFCPFDGKRRANLTKALLERGIDVLDYEANISEDLLKRENGDVYQYNADDRYVRYLKGDTASKDNVKKLRNVCRNIKNVPLKKVKNAEGEYKCAEAILYLYSVKDIIKAADENKNLTKLILPWKKYQGLYPLEGNLTAALGAIASTQSGHEWTIVLNGIADDKRYQVSRKLQESIFQAVGQRTSRQCCYNPVAGTIDVVKKGNFPAACPSDGSIYSQK